MPVCEPSLIYCAPTCATLISPPVMAERNLPCCSPSQTKPVPCCWLNVYATPRKPILRADLWPASLPPAIHSASESPLSPGTEQPPLNSYLPQTMPNSWQNGLARTASKLQTPPTNCQIYKRRSQHDPKFILPFPNSG